MCRRPTIRCHSFWMRNSELDRNVAGCFANYFESALNSQPQHLIRLIGLCR